MGGYKSILAMKQILFYLNLTLVALLFAPAMCELNAQEIIVEEDTYVPYQDSLFILRTLEITNVGLDGLNDTVVRYIPPALDTAGLITLISTRAQNSVNEKSARLARALPFRTTLNGYSDYADLALSLGSNLDSIFQLTYASQLKGNYRIITDTSNFVVTIDDHPSRTDVLRATGTEGEGTFNVKVRGAWFFSINLPDGTQFVVWDRDNRDRKVFRHPTFALPAAMGDVNKIRLIKLD